MTTAKLFLVFAMTLISSAAAQASNVFCITQNSLARETIDPRLRAMDHSSILIRATFRNNMIVSVDSLLVRVTPGNYKEVIQDARAFRGGLDREGHLAIWTEGTQLFSAMAWRGVRTPNKWVKNSNDLWFQGLLDMGLRRNTLGPGSPETLIEESVFCLLK